MAYWSIIVAAIAQMIIGYLWYGPLFGKIWMRLSKAKMNSKKSAIPSYVWMFVGSLVTAYILKIVLLVFPFASASGVTLTAVLLWLGFNVPVLLGSILWEGKSFKLYALNTLYYLVSYIVMAQILLAF